MKMSVKKQTGMEIADGIKFFSQLILQQGDYSRLSGWGQRNQKDPSKSEAGGQKSEETGRHCATGFKDVGGDHESRNASSTFQKLQKAKEQLACPLECPKECNPADSLISAQ